MHSHKDGGVAEWLKALAWKAGVRLKPYREFESHPLRQTIVSGCAPVPLNVLFSQANP